MAIANRGTAFLDYLYRSLDEALTPYAFQATGRFELKGIKEYVLNSFPKTDAEMGVVNEFVMRLIERLNEAAEVAFFALNHESSALFSPDFHAYKASFMDEAIKILKN